MIADELQIGKTSVYSILMEDLKMRKICAKTMFALPVMASQNVGHCPPVCSYL
jgi:hypothetical protein